MTTIQERLRHGAKGAWFVVGGDADNMLEAADIIDKLVVALEVIANRAPIKVGEDAYSAFIRDTRLFAREALKAVKGEQPPPPTKE